MASVTRVLRGECEASVSAFSSQYVMPISRDHPLVALNLAEALVDRLLQRNAPAQRPFPHKDQGILNRLGQVELGHFQLHAAGLALRQIEDVVDQR
jgi:hypothetical protein